MDIFDYIDEYLENVRINEGEDAYRQLLADLYANISDRCEYESEEDEIDMDSEAWRDFFKSDEIYIPKVKK